MVVPAPLLSEFARQLDGRYLACSQQLVDEIEAGGVPLGDRVEVVPNWVVGGSPATSVPILPTAGPDPQASPPPARWPLIRGWTS